MAISTLYSKSSSTKAITPAPTFQRPSDEKSTTTCHRSTSRSTSKVRKTHFFNSLCLSLYFICIGEKPVKSTMQEATSKVMANRTDFAVGVEGYANKAA